MPQKANAPGLSRGAAETFASGCLRSKPVEFRRFVSARQVIRTVITFLETYANRQLALRQIGRAP